MDVRTLDISERDAVPLIEPATDILKEGMERNGVLDSSESHGRVLDNDNQC